MTDFKVNVIIDPTPAKRGAGEVDKALAGLQTRAGSLGSSISRALTGLATFSTIKQLVGLADTYQSLQNKIRAVSDEGTNLAQTQAAIEGIAQRTRSGLAATTELYTRLITSSKELGKSQSQILSFTESLNKAIALSGASSAEAEAGILQLSQGLASGALRGDELRSVLEQLPAVADTIARGLGVTRGQLRKLGSEGKLSAEAIFQAFEKLAPELDEKFGRTVPTLSQNIVGLKNEVLSFVGASDQAAGVTTTLGQAFGFLAAQIREARQFYAGFREVLEEPQTEAALSSIGVQITSINKEIKDLESRAVVSETALARIEELKKRLAEFQQQAKGSLKLETPVSPEAQQAAAKAAAESAAAQKAALDAIKGPQEEYRIKLDAINALLQQGKITQDEYTKALDGLDKGLQKVTGGDASKAFEEQRKSLQEQNDLLSARISLGDIVAERLTIEQQFARDGLVLTEEQKKQLEQLLTVQQNLKDVEGKRSQEAEKLRQSQEQNAAALEQLAQELDVKAKILEEETRLNQLLLVRPDLFDQINERLEDLRLRALESSTALGDGFERAFIKIKREAEDLASVGEDIVNVFANQATDALTEFITTGQFSFKEFANAIIKDITRIIARLLIVQALNAAIGALGGGTGGGAGGVGGVAGAAAGALTGLEGRASGGPVSANRAYLVGENGPELFTPKQSGTIIPNGATAQAERPQVNVKLVNVTDPREVASALEDGTADEAILNVLTRQRDRLKQII